MNASQINEIVYEDDEIDLESSQESENEDDENEPIRALIQYRIMYEKRMEAEAARKKNRWILNLSMWSITIENLSTALRIFAPAAILSLFYGHDSFIFRILQQCDRAVRSVLFSKKENEHDALIWLQEIFPDDKRAKSLDSIWGDGSIICDVVETVVPGSCVGHVKESRIDLSHGQRLAEQYLGVTPIFSKEDLSQTVLTTYQECRLVHYLCCLKDALARLSPPVSRTGSPILNVQAYTLDYVARGMGLVTASRNRKASFYLYPTAQQRLEPGEISVQIKGPSESFGSILIPAIYGKTHIVRNVFFNLGHRQNLKDMQIPIAKSSTNDYSVSSSHFISKTDNDIEVSILIRNDRVKVFYTPKEIGHHELSLISKGCHIMGSPFLIHVEEERLERTESRDFEDEIQNVEMQADRKVVFRIVDFVTEKMLLTEDGKLEKISNEDANALLQTINSMEDITMKYLQHNNNQRALMGPDLIELKKGESNNKTKYQLIDIAKKVMLMLRICKELKDLAELMKMHEKSPSTPDIVNSTRREETFIKSAEALRNIYKNKPLSFNGANDTYEELDCIRSKITPSIDIVISSFDDDEADITIIPEVEALPERPKTPVFKILTKDDIEESKTELYNGFDAKNYEGQFDSLDYIINENKDLPKTKEFIDGRSTPLIDFHIGEPVTPTRMMSTPNLDGDMDSIIHASNLEEALMKYDIKIQKSLKDQERCLSEESNSSIFKTPSRQTPFEQMTDSEILEMYQSSVKLENTPETVIIDDVDEPNDVENCISLDSTRENSAETWDSAYMSIDEINSSPENNVNSPTSKSKLFAIKEIESDAIPNEKSLVEEIGQEEYSKMGPAEKELWKSVSKENDFNFQIANQYYPRVLLNREVMITPIDENEIYKTNRKDNQEKLEHVKYVLDDGSASDSTADVKRSTENRIESDNLVSPIQSTDAELADENQKEDEANKTPTKKSLSKMVSEKKEYWDDKIKSIEVNEEKRNKVLKKKTSSLRRNDSLSKKRNQQTSKVETRKKYNTEPVNFESLPYSVDGEESLVTRWKKYWNERIERLPTPESDAKQIRKELAKTRKYLTSPGDDSLESDSSPFLDAGEASKSPCASKPSPKENGETDKKYRAKSMSMSNLSERIDKFLDAVSSSSPTVNAESESSTPDSTVVKKKVEKIIQKENSLLKIEKDDDRLIVTWDESPNERRIKALESISNVPTPIFIEQPDEIIINSNDTEIVTENENVSEINELNSLSIDVKSKIENFNENQEKTKKSLLTKSKTIDIPRQSSFRTLKKYFSLENINSQVNNKNQLIEITENEWNKPLVTTPIDSKSLSASTDSIPLSLSEKKAKIELHLQSIQNRMKSVDCSDTFQPDIPKIIKPDDSTICREKDFSIKDEIKMISKSINSIVAAFESSSNTTKPDKLNRKIYSKSSTCVSVLDAESPEGTNGKQKQKEIELSVSPKDATIDKQMKNQRNLLTKENNVPEKTEIEKQNETDDEIRSLNYKERFQKAKAFFQTLEPQQKPVKKKINECEKLLMKSIENPSKDGNSNKLTSQNESSTEKKVNLKRKKFKAFSAPTSDTENEYSKYICKRERNDRLMKISEKFLVNDLFRDVIGESNQSRYGIFKGIPHKNAVLATFQSMENIDQFSSYEYTESQLDDFAKKNGIINSQTYHSEFPHLPTTDPSKYRSRYDATASGFITRKDLLKKTRRNSAPGFTDLNFTHYVNF